MSSVTLSPGVCPNRGVAFAIHLTISLIVFSTLVVLMLVYWFPGDLFFMDGGWEGLKLVAMVDLVLGPALTLILFKPGKPGLKMDLSVIAAIQIVALSYGFYTTYHQRVVAVVFADNEFATVSAKDKALDDAKLLDLNLIPNTVDAARAFNIPLYLTPAPENYGEYMAEVMNNYPSGHGRSDQYVSLSDNHDQLKRNALSKEALASVGALDKVEAAAASRDVLLSEVEVYDFRARFAQGYALYDPVKARIIDYVSYVNVAGGDALAENEE